MTHKRYDSEAPILGWIDKYNAEIVELEKEATTLDTAADKLRGTDDAHRIPFFRDVAENKRKRVLWRKGQIVKLKNVLAEIRTMPIEEVLKGDNSVQGI